MTDTGSPPVARIRNLPTRIGETVRLQGWLTHRRHSGKLLFLTLRDGSGSVQCVARKDAVGEEAFDALKRLPQESSLMLDGAVAADERSAAGVELKVTAAHIVGVAEEYPISNKEHTTGFLMEHRHLWLRSSKQSATLRVRARVIKAIRDYFDNRGYVCLDAPMFTPNACEGTSTLFEVDYFGTPAYLTQSGQLYGEAGAMALGKVYVFGPVFRAEKSKTRRHLTEFWMVEPEIAWAQLDDVMDIAEEFVSTVVADVLADCREDLAVLERDVGALEAIQAPFPRFTYSEAVDLLHEHGHEFEWGDDLGAPDEDLISSQFDRPVLIHRYPAAVKAFYMKRDPADDRLSLCVDMIAPEGYGEIIGGSQRADDLSFLEDQIAQHDLPKEAFDWYLDLRRYGTVPHGGFGLGLERLVAWICGTKHVRTCIPFPRLLDRLRP